MYEHLKTKSRRNERLETITSSIKQINESDFHVEDMTRCTDLKHNNNNNYIIS